MLSPGAAFPICVTCGTQYPDGPRGACPICEDERQYVPADGQAWTSMEALGRDHRNRMEVVEENLWGIGTEPAFSIAQRALLVRTPEGNVLWDCISLLDDETVERVRDLGGIDAIAISHPHYYSSMVEWAHAFGCPIHIHEAERRWVMRPDPAVRFWAGEEQSLPGGLMLHRLGGHFEGGQVLHWPAGAEGRGALLTGDIIQVVPDQGWVSFMYSYPNLIPLPAREVERIAAAVELLPFQRIYGAWWEKVIREGAKEAVRRSARRYVEALK